MFYVTVTGNGAVTNVGTLPSANSGLDLERRHVPPGRIIQMGGNSNGAIIVDVNGLSTPLTALTASMSTQRQWVNATILADGRVVGTSGSQVDNQLVGVNNSAEVWNPATGTWLVGPSGVNARLYHGNALLLPDGSVLVSGGGAPGPLTNLNAEIYYPSYLYDASGAFAARPTITSNPATLDIGTHFTLTTGGAGTIKRVTLVKTGSTTHSYNMDQRFIELYYTANGNQLDVMAPRARGRRAARVLPALRHQRSERAVDREDRAHERRREPESRDGSHANHRRPRRHALRTGLQCQRDPRRHRGTLRFFRRSGRPAVHPPRFDRSLDRQSRDARIGGRHGR
jgi:hypothetical protein